MSGARGAIRWHVYSDAAQLAAALAEEIAAEAASAIAERDAFLIVLAGGSTPRLLYSVLRKLDTDWSRWRVYFGDERCVPRGDPERNDAMARDAWLDAVPIPAAHVHPIPAELGPDAGAAAYAATLADVGPFDVTLLGLGEDGHTASLFPGLPPGESPDAPDALAVHSAPKPPPARVTLSARRLTRARRVVLLATGAAKRDAVAAAGREDPAAPVTVVMRLGAVDVWLDEAAAADIRSA